MPTFALKKPCENCPFRKVGAIDLVPGRLEAIIENLNAADTNFFQCHKTVHSRLGGEWTDDGQYKASGNESICVGSVVYMLKAHHKLPIIVRLGLSFGELTMQELVDLFRDVIEPPSRHNATRKVRA